MLTIARYTLIEALRSRLLWVALLALALLFSGGLFVREVSLMEALRGQIAFTAATVRIACVFLLSLFVIASMSREQQDGSVEFVLAHDVSRSAYLVGKLTGFVVIATALAAIAGIGIAVIAPGPASVAWTVTLALELCIVAAVALFSAVAFRQITPAMSFVMAFYLLARAINAMALISYSGLISTRDGAERVLIAATDWIALILPRLDLFANTQWLLGEPARAGQWLFVVGQTFVYVSLIMAATLFDFHRKHF